MEAGGGMTGTREIPNQITSGKEMSERDLFLMLTEYLGNCSDLARGLAHSRKDLRWLAVSGILLEVQDNVKKLMNKPHGLIIPTRIH